MAREKQQITSPEPWVLGAVLGLGEDGGWVDALKRELANRATEVGPCWEELLHLARGASTRGVVNGRRFSRSPRRNVDIRLRWRDRLSGRREAGRLRLSQ